MRHTTNRVHRLVVTAAVFLAVALIPVIPVMRSPVIPNPTSESAWISMYQLYSSRTLPGTRITGTWLTLPTIIGLSALAIGVGRSIAKPKRRSSDVKTTSPQQAA